MDAPPPADAAGAAPWPGASGIKHRPGGALAELLAPLPALLLGGGDARLALDRHSGLNAYGCPAYPTGGATGFSSSTATPISQRGFDRADRARTALLQSALASGVEPAFDARQEAMREELEALLGFDRSGAAVVFSASGTDAQLLALFLTRELLGAAPTTIIVAADQTGSGTALTAEGLHFADRTANGIAVRKGEPVCQRTGALPSSALPLRDARGMLRSEAACDQLVVDAAERVIATGGNVLLQVMDGSKLGWRLPSDQCVLDLQARWPGRVQVVVDACQMRLSRTRLAAYLERGYLVLVTGSKFFGGPAFSGAMLVPAAIAKKLDGGAVTLPQLRHYCRRSDWPRRWPSLRAQFLTRPNFGQWLRWEAALEEIRAYYAVPTEFRRTALAALGEAIARLIAASPSLRPLPQPSMPAAPDIDDDEMRLPTIFAFTIEPHGRALSLDRCKALHRAVAHDIRDSLPSDQPEMAAQSYLIGQPVGWPVTGGGSAAALRICIGARQVIECWSADAGTAQRNLREVQDRAAFVIEKLNAALRNHDSQRKEYAHAD